jgi:hypothetical protein
MTALAVGDAYSPVVTRGFNAEPGCLGVTRLLAAQVRSGRTAADKLGPGVVDSQMDSHHPLTGRHSRTPRGTSFAGRSR